MSTHPFSALHSAFQLRIAQLGCAAVNHLLNLEPSVQTHLKPHVGRTVLLRWDAMLIAPAGEQAFVISEQYRLVATDLAGKTADVTVNVMAGVLQANAETRLRFVRIEGDVWLAQDLSKVAKQLRWDAEHDLARVIGDTPAYWVVKHAKNTAQVFAQAADALKKQVSAGLTQTPGWALGSDAFEEHKQALAQLGLRISRLEQGLMGAAR